MNQRLLLIIFLCVNAHAFTLPLLAADRKDLGTKPKSAVLSKSDEAILVRARRSKQMFEDEEAIKDYTQYLTAHPDAENVRTERAEALRNEHRFDECIADLKILMRSKNLATASSAATDLGKLYQKNDKYQEAIKTYKYARSLGVTTLLTEIADCARLSGDNETALSVCDEIIKSGRPYEGRIRRAQANLAMHKPKLALDDLNFLVNFQRKYIANIDKESREIYTATKRLSDALEERAKCFDALKQSKLALQDKAAIGKLQQEVYNESPFLIKEKH